MMSDLLLESLKNSWHMMCEDEKNPPAFCYMLYLTIDDETPFVNLQKDLKLDGELIESGKFHATVRYIKTDMDYTPFIEFLKETTLPNISGVCTGFAIYGKDKDTLVVELDGAKLHEWFATINTWLVDNGYPKSDFPSYRPHISLTEKIGITAPEWKKEYEQKITFKIHVVSDTSREEVFRSVI